MTRFIWFIGYEEASATARTQKIVNEDIIAMIEPTQDPKMVKVTYRDGSEDHLPVTMGEVCEVLSDVVTRPYTIRDP